MKRFITILAMTCCVLLTGAQEVIDFSTGNGPVAPDLRQAPVADTLALNAAPAAAVADTLHLPALTWRGTVAHYPYWGSLYNGFSDWALHPGLNASLSASAIFGLGHHGGSGFANSLSLMYAGQLTPQLTYAVGGYYSHLDYSGRQFSDAGLTAMLSYRFDEHWEATVFAQKSIMQPRLPAQMYWMDGVGDKIGASLRYNFSPAFSVQVSVWDERRPNLYGPPAPPAW